MEKTVGQIKESFDTVHSLCEGKHTCYIEFSEKFTKLDKATGKPREKDGCVVEYKKVCFFDVDAKTKLIGDDAPDLTTGQLHFLFRSFDRMIGALEGKTEQYMQKYVDKTPIDIYVTKDPKFGKQYSAYPPRA